MGIKRMENFYKIEFDLESGFVWLGHREFENMIFVCCLKESKKGLNPYKKEIDRYNSGYDDGVCGDINLKLYTQGSVLIMREVFFSFAKKAGIRVV